MEKYGQIPVILKGVVFSDPSYDDTVWCQYRKQFTDTNWLMKLESSTEDGFISFQLTLGRPTVLSGVKTQETEEGIRISFPGRFDAESVEIGMDTAQIFCGLQEYWSDFGQEAALRTGTDGFFGDLTVFTCKGEKNPAGFLLIGGIGEFAITEEDLFHHFASSFNAKEITAEHFQSRTDPKSLAMRMGTSVEIRHANELNAAKAGNENELDR